MAFNIVSKRKQVNILF